jgi:hypothetical protein
VLDQPLRTRVRSGEDLRRPVRHLFLFIGADPNTDWLSRDPALPSTPKTSCLPVRRQTAQVGCWRRACLGRSRSATSNRLREADCGGSAEGAQVGSTGAATLTFESSSVTPPQWG